MLPVAPAVRSGTPVAVAAPLWKINVDRVLILLESLEETWLSGVMPAEAVTAKRAGALEADAGAREPPPELAS